MAYNNVFKNYLEIELPKMVSARYVTACMLECENYLQDSGDLYHDQTNIDIKTIAFKGLRVVLPTEV